MGLPGLPEPGFSETQPTDLGSIGPSNSAISHGLPGLPMPGFSEQVPEQSGGIFSTIKNFGSGSLRGAAQLAALGGDIVTSVPRWGLEYLTNRDIPSMSSAMEDALSQIGLGRKDSLAQRIGEFAVPLGSQYKALQMGTGALMGAANYGAEKLLPNNPIAQTAITIGAGLSPFAVETAAKSLFRTLSPKAGATHAAKQIAAQLRELTPNALTEALSPAERAKLAAEALEAKGIDARKAAGKMFENLPQDAVILDDAIKNISNFAEQVGGPISPAGQTNSVISFLQRLKPQDQVINIPASTILDQSGNPLREAVSMTIPGGPAKLPLNKVQDTLRDIGKLGYGAQGVEAAILGRARDEILKAAEASVKPESMEAFKGARAAWREMSQTYEEGAVGAVRNSVSDIEGRLNTFRNKLLNDPKGAEQLAHVMSAGELNNAQNLILTDLLKRQPVSWEREISQKYDSYKAIFGEEGANRLLDMVSRDGSIGKKLLQDNNGLKTLFTKLTLKTAVGGALGYEAGGTEGAVIGGLLGLASNRAEGLRVSRAKSIIMRAAAGNPEALKILNTPARSLGYGDALKSLANVIKQGGEDLIEKAKGFVRPIDSARLEAETGAVSTAWLPESAKTPMSRPLFDPIERTAPKQYADIEEAAINKLHAEGPDLIDKYIKANTKDGVLTLDTDKGRPFVSNSKISQGTHEAASELVRAVGRLALNDPAIKDVTILSGGPGAGKSTASAGFQQNQLVFDKIIKSKNDGIKLIDQILNKNKTVDFLYIYNKPEVALPRAWERAIGPEERAVPITHFAERYPATAKSFVDLVDHYKGNENVYFTAIDNSLPNNKPHKISVDDVRKIVYNDAIEGKQALEGRLRSQLEDLYETTKQEIPAKIDRIYRQFRGDINPESSASVELAATREGAAQRASGDGRNLAGSAKEKAEAIDSDFLNAQKYPVVETPIKDIKLSSEVKNFKAGANEKGVVEPLSGRFERRGLGPIAIWERLDGSKEVISGRHRLDLARRSGEKTIPSQIYRESEGFTASDARKLDAELNIIKERGSVTDYSRYFHEANLTQEAALERGFLSRSKGKMGFAIGGNASDDVYALHQAGKLTDKQAMTIAQTAPKNAALQRVGSQAALKGAEAEDIRNIMDGARDRIEGVKDAQGEMFGIDDSYMQAALAQARIASNKRAEISQQIKAVQNAAKNPKIAAKFGVDVKDPEGILKKVEELKLDLYKWEKWNAFPEIKAEIKKELQAKAQGARGESGIFSPAASSAISIFGAGAASVFTSRNKEKNEAPMSQIPKQLLNAVKEQESGGKINAVSPAGAKGLYQLMDATGKEWHAKLGLPGKYDPFDAKQNETIAKAYLGWLSDQFGGDVKLALASFNYGIGNIKKLLSKYSASTFEEIKGHLPKETAQYVPSILARANLPSDVLEA